MYKAKDIAAFVINYCISKSNPITNLKLQCLLYFVQGEHIKRRVWKLIDDDFYVGGNGPNIPEVYGYYSRYAAFDIPIQKQVYLDKNTELIISETLEKYMRVQIWDLVNKAKSEDPWKYVHKIYGVGTKIPPQCIDDYYRTPIS